MDHLLDIYLVCGLFVVYLRGTANAELQGCKGDKFLNFTEDFAVLTSDNFPANYFPYTWCRYYIHGPPGTWIRLNFTFLNMEQSHGCQSDNLKIFDLAKSGMADVLAESKSCDTILGHYSPIMTHLPTKTARPTFGPFCAANSLPASINTIGNGVVIEFCTDYEVQDLGWSVGLIFEPSTETSAGLHCQKYFDLSELTGSLKIESPNYPKQYDGNGCEWTIKTSPNYPVKIWIHEVDLGGLVLSQTEMAFDFLSVSDVTNNNTNEYSMANPMPPITMIRTTNEIIITLRPNGNWANFGGRGFSLELSHELCESKGQVLCDDLKGCVNSSNLCDGTSQCEDGSDEKVEYCFPDCGQPHYPIFPANRVVGGIMADEYSLPWQAAIIMNFGVGAGGPFPLPNQQFCGASILSDRWLLSAAHCYVGDDRNATNLKARLGGHFLNSVPVEQDASVEIPFEKIICHPLYKQDSNGFDDYDYCLVKLKSKIHFRKNISPICLPRQGDDPKAGTVCMVSGWGNTRPARDIELRQVYLTVVDRERCNKTEGEMLNFITDRMICAGTPGGGQGTCQGDSGGPFACKNSQGRWSLSGITSWAVGCGRPGISGVSPPFCRCSLAPEG